MSGSPTPQYLGWALAHDFLGGLHMVGAVSAATTGVVGAAHRGTRSTPNFEAWRETKIFRSLRFN
jgi:hypothetical protein